jgi:hypothetical protein
MIIRLFDSSERVIPGEAKWETVTINGYVLPTKESNVIRYDTYDKAIVESAPGAMFAVHHRTGERVGGGPPPVERQPWRIT